MDPAQPTATGSPRRARLSPENAHVTGELPVMGNGRHYVGRHRVTPTTRTWDYAAYLVGRTR